LNISTSPRTSSSAGVGALQLQRNRADRAHVLGHVLAGRAVAARRRLHEHAALVAQRNGEPVELQLARVFDGVRHRAGEIGRLVERIGDALVERDDVVVAEAVVQRQHRRVVNDRREPARHCAADALRRRIGRHEFGMIGFELLQLAEQSIVFGVGQVRLIEHVVGVVRPLELIAQPRGARVGLAGWRFGLGSGHAGGRCSEKSEFRLSQFDAATWARDARPRRPAAPRRCGTAATRSGVAAAARRTRYWLNRRRVTGEPAGMPASSSFAYSFISCWSIATSADSGSGRRESSTTRAPMRSDSDFA
jgi:hypothetical protein